MMKTEDPSRKQSISSQRWKHEIHFGQERIITNLTSIAIRRPSVVQAETQFGQTIIITKRQTRHNHHPTTTTPS